MPEKQQSPNRVAVAFCYGCRGVWHGGYGVVSSYPAINGAVYEQVGDLAFYIDQTMLDMFQDLNGVK